MQHVTLPIRRRLLAAVALLAAPAVVLASPGTADAAPTHRPAPAAAGWLGHQLNPDTHVIEGSFGGQTFPDYGLTADVVLALDSAKVGRVAARRATHALQAHVLDYTGFGDPSAFFAGAVAKLLVVAEAQGADPRAFGSGPRHNLVATLRSLECGRPGRTDCAAADRGRFADRGGDDFSNAFSQSLALVGLERSTRLGPSRASVSFLIGQQCRGGGFPQDFGKSHCSASVDATGVAVQALSGLGSGRAHAAAVAGGRWLARHQHKNGSFSGNGGRNANSTALAAQALTAVDRATQAAEARHFLRTLQVRCHGKPENRGKIRYDLTGTGDDVRATSQAVPALAQATLSDIDADGVGRGLPALAC